MYFIRTSSKTTLWSTEAPEHCLFKKEIKMECDYLPSFFIVDARTNPDKNFMPPVSYHYPVSFLKSNIQKTLRQGKLEACISTTQQLLRQDPQEVLRRLPIIFAEDAQFHIESLNLIIWLMVAHSKGYQLSKTDERLILDSVATAHSAMGMYTDSSESSEYSIDSLSLLVRSCYGGTVGDMNMMRNLAKRIHSLSFIPDWVHAPPCVPFSIEHMVKESIDFHCCPQLLVWCSEKTNLQPEDIKAAIWHHWSSPNIREHTFDEKSYSTFQRIHYLLEQYALGKIKNMNVYKKKVMIQTKLNFTATF